LFWTVAYISFYLIACTVIGFSKLITKQILHVLGTWIGCVSLLNLDVVEKQPIIKLAVLLSYVDYIAYDNFSFDEPFFKENHWVWCKLCVSYGLCNPRIRINVKLADLRVCGLCTLQYAKCVRNLLTVFGFEIFRLTNG
jgi:hypothetical protein